MIPSIVVVLTVLKLDRAILFDREYAIHQVQFPRLIQLCCKYGQLCLNMSVLSGTGELN